MSDADLHAKIAQMQQLFQRRMRAGGTLMRQVRRRQNRLPRNLRSDAWRVAEAVPLLEHPKLSRQLDMTQIADAADRVIAHLKLVDPRDRPWVKVVQVLSWVLLALVVVGLAYLVYLNVDRRIVSL